MTSKHPTLGLLLWLTLGALSSCAMHPNVAKRSHAYYVHRNEGPKAAAYYCASEGLEKWCWSDLEFWATVDRR